MKKCGNIRKPFLVCDVARVMKNLSFFEAESQSVDLDWRPDKLSWRIVAQQE
jgi:hypothetical protein